MYHLFFLFVISLAFILNTLAWVENLFLPRIIWIFIILFVGIQHYRVKNQPVKCVLHSESRLHLPWRILWVLCGKWASPAPSLMGGLLRSNLGHRSPSKKCFSCTTRGIPFSWKAFQAYCGFQNVHRKCVLWKKALWIYFESFIAK